MAEISVADGGFEAAESRRAGPFRAIAEALAAESDRRILWAPVFFGAGIALYFALTVEPPCGSAWVSLRLPGQLPPCCDGT